MKRAVLLSLLTAALIAPVSLGLSALLGGRGGADDTAGELALMLAPEYRPWMQTPGLELSDEHEPWLFAAQSAAGAGLLTFACLALRRRPA
ncbi:MAG: cobalt ABC transporter substrate-binding protein CbiN [Candidatus Solibacter sp.]|nr:cobalt ABC transporter substrate-binding protein CbiN [Candidatus Solibacter sp.]